jgi:rSAM/selenodomain-associated transferase 1
MSRTQVLVITKAPVPGRSKTRLTPPCSPDQAAGIAAAAVGDTLDTVRAAPVAGRVVALDGHPGPLDLDGFHVFPQVEGDLGARLAAAFADAMADGPVPTLLIGMDTPQVTPELLAMCAALLESTDPGTAVLGPAPDGGWWALGLHSAEPAAVLASVPMSRADTAVLTRQALEATGLTVLDLPPLTDIDHFPDALAVAGECAATSRTAQAVASVATALGIALGLT